MNSAKHQTEAWQGDFGQRYTNRNFFSPIELDCLYKERYGISRSELNRRFVGNIDRRASILEVGCNVGNQLLLLMNAGFQDLNGIDLQIYSLNLARDRLENARFSQATALDLPFSDNSFDMVFTSGVLIHLPPSALVNALKEIHRCTRRFIWGFEYFAEDCMQIRYRGQEDLLWKADYAELFMNQYPHLSLVDKVSIYYVDGEQVDMMFMLEKSI